MVVLLTDQEPEDLQGALVEANYIKRKNATLMVVAVGDEMRRDFLTELASPDHLILTETHLDLEGTVIQHQLVDKFGVKCDKMSSLGKELYFVFFV